MDDIEIDFQAGKGDEQAPPVLSLGKKKKSKRKKKNLGDEISASVTPAEGDEVPPLELGKSKRKRKARKPGSEEAEADLLGAVNERGDSTNEKSEDKRISSVDGGNAVAVEPDVSKKSGRKKNERASSSRPNGFAAPSLHAPEEDAKEEEGNLKRSGAASSTPGFIASSSDPEDPENAKRNVSDTLERERSATSTLSKKNTKNNRRKAKDNDVDAVIASLTLSAPLATPEASTGTIENSNIRKKPDEDGLDDILRALEEPSASSSKKKSKKKKKKGKAGNGQEKPSSSKETEVEVAFSEEAGPSTKKEKNEDNLLASLGLVGDVKSGHKEQKEGANIAVKGSDPSGAAAESENITSDSGAQNSTGQDELLASLGLETAPGSAKQKSAKKKRKKPKKAQTSAAGDGLAVEVTSVPAEKEKPKKKESAAVRRLREARARAMAEQERQRKLIEEEEARAAAEEKAARQAALAKEEARKRKKEAERLRKERLRKEGKLLTKAEKERKRRAEAARQMFESQGMIPASESNKEESKQESGKGMKRRVVYGRKKKKKGPVKEEEVDESFETERGEPSTPSVRVEETKALPAVHSEEELLEWDAVYEDEGNESEGNISDETSEKDKESDLSRSEEETEESSCETDGEYGDMSHDEIIAERRNEKYRNRRQKALEDAANARSLDRLRSPIICIMGHVDTGKTKILDRIRRTNVQDGEAGGITQQIGATYFPIEAVIKEANKLEEGRKLSFNLPALLIIDTPGHESFTNLRSRGSSLCDIAILVVDIMHGLEPQTMESIELLKIRKTPFIVALNKIDRMFDWKPQHGNCPVRDALAAQSRHVCDEFDRRVRETQLAFAKIGFNSEVYWKNTDARKTLSLVPTSAITGEGMPDLLMLLVALSQKLLTPRLMYSSAVECTILEVKVIEGHGTTIDVILTGGKLRGGDTIAVMGLDGPIITTIRALLTPHAMREMRVKGQYLSFDEIDAAQGIKIAADGLEKAVAGTQLLVAENPEDEDEIEFLKDEVMKDFESILNSVDRSVMGVYVQASTLGSLEALLDFLRSSKIRVSGINIGPVHKRDVTKASTMLEKQQEYATILAFDVPVEREARELAEEVGVRIFTADIIYHLFDQFTAYMEEVRKKRREEISDDVVFPSILEIIPTFVFNKKDPILVGVDVKEGLLRVGTPLVVKKSDGGWLDIGRVTSIELNKKSVTLARRKESVAIKIEGKNTENIMYGRHFDHTDPLVSKMSRKAIDILKESFRDDLEKDDWRLVVKLKAMFKIE